MSVRFFLVKVFFKACFCSLLCSLQTSFKRVSRVWHKWKKKSCSDMEPHNVSIEHVQIFKSKEGNHPSLQRGVLTRMTIG